MSEAIHYALAQWNALTLFLTDARLPVRIRRTVNIESGLNDGIATPFVKFFLVAAVAVSRLVEHQFRSAVEKFSAVDESKMVNFVDIAGRCADRGGIARGFGTKSFALGARNA